MSNLMEDAEGNDYSFGFIFGFIGLFIGAFFDSFHFNGFPMFLVGGSVGLLIGLFIHGFSHDMHDNNKEKNEIDNLDLQN